MDAIFLFILVFLNLLLFHFFFRYIFPHEGWISPIAFFLPFYQLIYPLRAIVVFFSIGTSFEADICTSNYNFTRWEVIWALLYATFFAWVLVIFYAILVEKRQKSRILLPKSTFNRWQHLFFVFLVTLYFIVFYLKVATEGLYGLYEANIESIKRPFLINLIFTGLYIEHLLLTFTCLRYLKTRSRTYLLFAIMIVLCIFLRALVSTSKGDLVELFMVLVACYCLFYKKLPVKLISVGLVMAIGFSFYSFTVRREGNVVRSGASNPITSVRDNIQTFYNSYLSDKDLWKKQVSMLTNRLYGIDPIILCMRKKTFVEEGLYAAGSLADLGNVVPRIFWPDRPHLSFNHYLSHEVWQRPPKVLAEMPIGKVGESFFVLNWGGILYAFFYAGIWRLFYAVFIRRGRDETDHALYISLLILYVFPDANLTYNWKLVLVTLAVVGVFRQLRYVYDKALLPGTKGGVGYPLNQLPPGFVQT